MALTTGAGGGGGGGILKMSPGTRVMKWVVPMVVKLAESSEVTFIVRHQLSVHPTVSGQASDGNRPGIVKPETYSATEKL